MVSSAYAISSSATTQGEIGDFLDTNTILRRKRERTLLSTLSSHYTANPGGLALLFARFFRLDHADVQLL